MPMLQISNNYITLGNTERSLQLNSYLDVLIRADGTNILESNSSTLYLGSANKMTNINGSSISIGSDGTNVGIGGSNSAVIIQGSTIALNPSKGLYVNGNLGTAGQVLTSNGAALSPT